MLARGLSLEQLQAMSTAEVEMWREYHRRFGFEVDRVVWTVAVAGAAINQAWGSRRKAKDNVAVFWRPKGLSNKELIARLSALPGAKVEFIPKGKANGSR